MPCFDIHERAGTEVVCYESPRPVLGIHRVVFLLFQQLGRQTVYAPGWRQNFSTRDFAELYNLGLPVAAVYFNCQRESGTGGRRMWSRPGRVEINKMTGNRVYVYIYIYMYMYVYLIWWPLVIFGWGVFDILSVADWRILWRIFDSYMYLFIQI